MLWEKRKERRGIAPLIGALIPLITGILSAGGSMYANNKNRQIAKDQMAFQERMSSTAAQRSKADYEAAGLNPALAYERTASSPGGASATIEDALGKGISGAQSASRLKTELEIMRKQSAADINLKGAQEAAANSNAFLAQATERESRQRLNFAAVQQPYDLNYARARALVEDNQASALALQNILTGYSLPGARNEANFQNRVGSLPQSLSAFGPGARTAAEIFNLIKERAPKGVKFTPPQISNPFLELEKARLQRLRQRGGGE